MPALTEYEKFCFTLRDAANDLDGYMIETLLCDAADRIERLIRVCDDKEKHLDGYRRAADDDRAEIRRLKGERNRLFAAVVEGERLSVNRPDENEPLPHSQCIARAFQIMAEGGVPIDLRSALEEYDRVTGRATT